MSEAPDESGFSYDNEARPHAYIQWKGTDVCMDFHCECGAHCHFDGDFAYVVECPHCHVEWEMPFNVFPRKLTAANRRQFHSAKLMERDEDMDP